MYINVSEIFAFFKRRNVIRPSFDASRRLNTRLHTDQSSVMRKTLFVQQAKHDRTEIQNEVRDKNNVLAYQARSKTNINDY